MKATWIATLGFFLVVGLPLSASAGPNLDANDADGDGVNDSFDNCVDDFNAGQKDANHNGCGDTCDVSCDANNDGVVGVPDYLCVITDFGGPPVSGSNGGDCDCNDDNVVGIPDFLTILSEFGKASGPSGIPIENPLHDVQTCHPKS